MIDYEFCVGATLAVALMQKAQAGIGSGQPQGLPLQSACKKNHSKSFNHYNQSQKYS